MVQKTAPHKSLVPSTIDQDTKSLILLPPTNEKTLEWLAVLGAAGVGYDLTEIDGPWRIIVTEENRGIAMQQLAEYEQECTYWPPKLDRGSADTAGLNLPSAYAGVCLLCFFFVTGPYDPDVLWFNRGQGNPEKFLSGELWRVVTALTLHSDFSHVTGNVIGCVFLCGAVCQFLGSGLGWLLILLAGTTANVLGAVMVRPAYVYVGASTAIFAAIGILGALQSIRLHRNVKVYTHRLYLPLLSVFAILSVLGTGPKADLWGHFIGAICGIFLGLLCSFLKACRNQSGIQICSLMVVVGMILLSWGCALGKVGFG
jgi:rhomboid protease GluP